MIVDDETQGAQIVVLNDGSLIAGQFIPLITDTFDEKKGKRAQPVELDAEGVAFADGTFYVIGSHGWPRLKKKDKKELDPATLESMIQARAKAARHLFAIAFDLNKVDLRTGMLMGDYDKKDSTELTSILKAEPQLKHAFDSPLDQYGVTIEGIAARDGKLFIGLRSPVAKLRDAIVIEVPAAKLFAGAAGAQILHPLKLDRDTEDRPRGIRDLCTVGKSFLVIAGPILDPEEKEKPIAPGDYAIFGWDGTSKLVELRKLGGFPAETKPEGCWPLAQSTTETELLIVFDGPLNGAPQKFVIPR